LTSNTELHQRRKDAVPRGVSNSLAVYAERAANAELWDVEGRRYIDFASGIAVLNTGHVHPKVKEAIARQLDKLTHTCFQVTPYESYIALAEQLNALAPGASPKKTMFLTTGAEAVENAIKIARFHTKRSGVIAFSGSFHGRTLACISLTGKVQPYKAGFGPMLSEIYHVPYPMPYHGVTVEHSLQALEQLFKADVDPARVAAIIIEPVLGEGGFYVATPELLRRLRSLCDSHGIVLIADEIQTGFAPGACSRSSTRVSSRISWRSPRVSPAVCRCRPSSARPTSWTPPLRADSAAHLPAHRSPAPRDWRCCR